MMLARSALYVPADHDRAMAKVASLDADVIIYDLEDGVAPGKKAYARDALRQRLSKPNQSKALKLIRFNHSDTHAYQDDLALLSDVACDGIMLSKVSGAQDVRAFAEALSLHERADLAVWCNIETALGVCHACEIAAQPQVAGIVAGTNDLRHDLRLDYTPDRAELMVALQQLLLAARAYGRVILDGTFIDLEDEQGLIAEAMQGRRLGFDGKTLIHPKQIDVVHRIFSPTEEEITHAEAVIAAYEQTMQQQKAVTLLHGRMIERLHYDRALQTLEKGTYD